MFEKILIQRGRNVRQTCVGAIHMMRGILHERILVREGNLEFK